jgi:hypothetical protein
MITKEITIFDGIRIRRKRKFAEVEEMYDHLEPNKENIINEKQIIGKKSKQSKKPNTIIAINKEGI